MTWLIYAVRNNEQLPIEQIHFLYRRDTCFEKLVLTRRNIVFMTRNVNSIQIIYY